MTRNEKPLFSAMRRYIALAASTLVATIFLAAMATPPDGGREPDTLREGTVVMPKSATAPITLSYEFGEDAAEGGYACDFGSLPVPGDPDFDFRTQGVVCVDDILYTWYSENVLPGYGLTALNENGRHVGEDGLIRDGEGYIAVASDDYPLGTTLDTPFGFAKVYDTGCPSGTIDVYTSF